MSNFVGMMAGMGGDDANAQPASPLDGTAPQTGEAANAGAAAQGDGMSGMAAQPTSPLAGDQRQFNERVVPPKIVFPTEGAYVAFVNVRPRGGDELNLTMPITVGAASTSSARLTPDASSTQTLDDLRITLKTDDPLQAGRPTVVAFDVIPPTPPVSRWRPTSTWNPGCALTWLLLDEALTNLMYGGAA